MIAASVTVFFYMSTGGYDSCYPETFHRQLISPFADLSPYFPFHQFLRKCHHSALLSRTKPAILSHLHSPSMTSCLISISILKESFSVMFRKQYYISFLYIYMNDTSVSRDFFPTCRKKKPTYSRLVSKESQTYTRRLHVHYMPHHTSNVTLFTICT